MTQAAAEQFRLLVEQWLPAYEKLVVSAVGVFANGVPKLLAARVVFAPNVIEPGVSGLTTSTIWARSELAPTPGSNFDRFVEDIACGKLRVGDLEAALVCDQGTQISRNYYPGYHPAYAGNQSAPRLPALIVTGSSRYAALNNALQNADLDWHLRALNPPFLDLSDLHFHFGLPSPVQAGESAQIELVARPPVEIDGRSLLESGKAHIRVVAAKGADLRQVGAGYRGLSGGAKPVRGVVPQFEWTETDKVFEGTAIVDVGDTATVQCFLSYAGIGTQQWWIIDPKRHQNPRQATHAAFDPELGVVRRFLFESKRSDSRSFEDGVAILLNMLGFSVTQHGRSQKLSDAPDIIATTPSGRTAVVECTVGLPDQDDQVATVLRRAEVLRRALTAAGWGGIEVLPVVVTALSAAEVSGQRDAAERQGVIVVCAENLNDALMRVAFPVDADQLYATAIDRLRGLQIKPG